MLAAVMLQSAEFVIGRTATMIAVFVLVQYDRRYSWTDVRPLDDVPQDISPWLPLTKLADPVSNHNP